MKQLRILTANLWNGRAEPGAIADLIAQTEPDALLVQELAFEQARTIERLMPHGVLLPRNDKLGMGLALRRAAEVSRLPMPRRDALRARIDAAAWPGLPFALEIINVHLSAPTRLSRFALRRAQLLALHGHLATGAPRVLAGDLNSLRVMPAYRALRAGLRDAALERRPFPVPTWSPLPDWPRLLRIDHVLLRGLHAIDVKVLRVRGSDHSAVLATLGFD
jgi:endonuclease/exonuclease/phosphatase family metal-dependent hydrolase